MGKQKSQHSPKFKFGVALEAVKETKTINQVAMDNSIHPNIVSRWKRKLLDEGINIFIENKGNKHQILERQET